MADFPGSYNLHSPIQPFLGIQKFSLYLTCSFNCSHSPIFLDTINHWCNNFAFYFRYGSTQPFKYSIQWVQDLVYIYHMPAITRFTIIVIGNEIKYIYIWWNTTKAFIYNCRDCLVTTAVNCFTSFFSGFVIFTYLGFMSHKQGVPISSVATEGIISIIKAH